MSCTFRKKIDKFHHMKPFLKNKAEELLDPHCKVKWSACWEEKQYNETLPDMLQSKIHMAK